MKELTKDSDGGGAEEESKEKNGTKSAKKDEAKVGRVL